MESIENIIRKWGAGPWMLRQRLHGLAIEEIENL